MPEIGVEELFMGLASQIAEREDSVLCSDVRGKQSFSIWAIIRMHINSDRSNSNFPIHVDSFEEHREQY